LVLKQKQKQELGIGAALAVKFKTKKVLEFNVRAGGKRLPVLHAHFSKRISGLFSIQMCTS
jgi:hypothetical protein